MQLIKKFDYADFFMLCEFLEARDWDCRGGVCGRLWHGVPHGGAEGTEERV